MVIVFDTSEIEEILYRYVLDRNVVRGTDGYKVTLMSHESTVTAVVHKEDVFATKESPA